MTSGIYIIVNALNGNRYVGSSTILERRWKDHRWALRHGKHFSRHLQAAWAKYGEAAFCFEVLEEWEPDLLGSMEQWWINMLRPEYNCRPVGPSVRGLRHSEETKARLSAMRQGKPVSKRVAEAFSARIQGNTYALGKHWRLTEETKKRQSNAAKRRHALKRQEF